MNFAKRLLKSITFFYIDNNDIELSEQVLKKRYELCQRIPGTKKFHKFRPLSKNQIEVFELSSDSHGIVKKIIDEKIISLETDVQYNICEYIVCLYMKRKYIGMITFYSEKFGDYIANFMQLPAYSKYY